MAKSDGNSNNNKARSSKPYDASNSFVKKVASRVSGLIPQSPSWLSGWFSPSEPNQGSSKDRREQLPSDDDDFQDASEQPPPAKRFRLADNQQFALDSYSRGAPIVQGESRSRRVQNDFADVSSVPGPSGLDARGGGFAISTPAIPAMGHQETKTNGGECSESGESTSGCSSLEPQVNRAMPSAQGSSQARQHDSSSPRKRLLDGTLNYSEGLSNYLIPLEPSVTQNSRSLFLDRSMNSRHNQSVGRRNKPSFCVNTFGSPMFGDRSSLNDLILNSPFYAGRTTFGGASSSSYRRSIGSASVSSSPANSDKLPRHTIKVKPSHSSSSMDSSMSQTARRILATLEQFSTPVLDAKRIPVSPQDQTGDSSGTRKRSRSDVNDEPRLVLDQPRTPARSQGRTLHWAGAPPSTSKLTIPVVPDSLVLRRRERLQDSTTAARLMASSAVVSDSTCGLEAYRLRTQSETNKGKHSLKMKPPSRTRQERDVKEPEVAPEVNLPKIPLPIASLPSFDIAVPPPKPITSISNVSVALPQVSCSSPVLPVSKFPVPVSLLNSKSPQISSPILPPLDASFSFSSPIGVSPAVKDKALASISNFSFSSPLPASSKPSEALSNCTSARPKAKDSVSFTCGVMPATELKTGSVMDILGKKSNGSSNIKWGNTTAGSSLLDKFKPAAGSWECDKCLIRNKSELTRCAACTNPKEVTKSDTGTSTALSANSTLKTSKIDSSFGKEFKMGAGMWECSACMVRNKESDEKCVACTGPKPGSKPPKPAANASTAFSGWGDKFKPAANTWECSACMVRNALELTACQACTTKKPASSGAVPASCNDSKFQSNWGDKFKKPTGSWQCGDCLVDNKPSDVKCAACQAKKPGAENQPPSPTLTSAPKFSFGIPSTSAETASTLNFVFGARKDQSENEDSKATVTSSTGFSFGGAKASAPTTSFSFGVPAAAPPTSPATVEVVSPSKPVAGRSPAIEATSAVTLPVNTSASTVTTCSPSTAVPIAESITVASPAPEPGVSSSSPLTTSSAQLPVKAPAVFGALSVPAEGKEVGPKPPDVFANFKFEKSPASVTQSQSQSQPSGASEGNNQGTLSGGKRKHTDDTPSSTVISFKFGAASQPDLVSPATSNSTSTSSSVSSTSGPVFCFSASSTSGNAGLVSSAAPQPVAANSPFSKVAPSSSSGKVDSMFTIGATSTKDESVTSTWKQTVANTPLPTDLKTSVDSGASCANTKPIFGGFGSCVSSSSFGSGTIGSTPVTPFTFGAATEKSSSINKPTLSFGAPNSAASTFITVANTVANSVVVPSFGLSVTSGFGSPVQSTNSSTSFTSPALQQPFGSSASSSTTPAFGTTFGASSDEKKPPSLFNSSEEKKPFSFGASADEKKAFPFQASTTTLSSSFQSQSRTVFTFGSSTSTTNGPSKPDFGFGASSAPNAFPNFNSPQSTTPSAGFNFVAPSSTSSVFGTINNNPTPTPSPFGTPTPTTSNTLFGSAAPAFSVAPFGSTSQPSGGFNFSSSGTTTFGSQNQTSAAPAPFAFAPNVKPTFNFTGGSPVNFAAPPSDGPSASAHSGRRIRKATRRTPR